MAEPIYWLSPLTNCDWCGTPFERVFGAKMYDARSKRGPWGNFCPTCFHLEAGSLGTGHGQEYTYQPDGRWLKTAG